MASKVCYIDSGAAEAGQGLKPIPALKTPAAAENHADLKGAFPSGRGKGFGQVVSAAANAR